MRTVAYSSEPPSVKGRKDSPMEHRKALMIDLQTGRPIDPSWTPTLRLEELALANERMANNRLHYRWQWIPGHADLAGTALLNAA